MNIPLVDLKAQYRAIEVDIKDAISDVLERCTFIGGASFEEAYAAYCGVKHCVGVANGTDALTIALRALGIGADDEVITAANTFIATSEAITLAGARPVFVDVDPRTFNIDTRQIEAKITPRTKAIIPVHLYGQPADMDPILQLAASYKLKVIEDACQAHGGVYQGRKVGAMGDVACFSFYPGKNLGAYGDAGALVTNDPGVAIRARMIGNHGGIKKYEHEIEGTNSRLDGIQAAVLQVKLKYLPAWTERRRAIAKLYNELLQNTELTTPAELDDVYAVYHLYVVRTDAALRDQLLSYLNAKGIGAGLHYPTALPNLKAYAHLQLSEREFPEATKASREIISLPIFPELQDSQVRYVAEMVSEFFASVRRRQAVAV